jgi:fumarate hydratase class II
MPGKVNPVIPEAVIMACAQVFGYDAAIGLGGLGGHFEINLMMPLIAHDLLAALALLANAAHALATRCIAGLEVNAQRCREDVERSLALATALAPAIGHDRAAQIAQTAERTGRTVREVAQSQGVLSPQELDALLAPDEMTKPG